MNGLIGKIWRKLTGRQGNAALDGFLTDMKQPIGGFKIVFDVGAYQGNFISEILKLNPRAEVHAFEPFGESFRLITEKFNGYKNVLVNHAAVSDVAGKATLNVNAFKETNSLLESGHVDDGISSLTKQQSTEMVEVVSLEEYCAKHSISKIDLVKIDTQGNSYNVLKGLGSLLSDKKIRYLYVEAEFIEIYKNEKLFSEIELFMREKGYMIVNLYNLNSINKEKLGWCDVLFTPKN